MMPIQNEPGWTGAFTRHQVLGGWRNGTRIVKVNTEPGDANPDGALGTVLGSLAHQGQVAYFIEWDNAPRVAVGCVGFKLAFHEQCPCPCPNFDVQNYDDGTAGCVGACPKESP